MATVIELHDFMSLDRSPDGAQRNPGKRSHYNTLATWIPLHSIQATVETAVYGRALVNNNVSV